MSDQEQKPISTATLRRHDQPGWFALSVVLHVLVAIALIFLTPIRSLLMEEFAAAKASSTSQMSTQQLIEVDEKLSEITEDHIEGNVRALQELLKQMQFVNDEEFKEFVVFEHAQIEQTPEVVNDSLEQALAAMKQANESIKASDRSAAITQQALAASHQEAIQQRLELVQASEEVRKSQQQAVDVQEQAAKETVKANDAIKQLQEIEHKLKYPQQEMTSLETRVPKHQQVVDEAAKKRVENQTKLSDFQKTLQQAKDKEDAKAIERSNKQVKAAEEAVGRAEKSVETKQAEKIRVEERLKQFQSQVTELLQSKDQQQKIADAAHQQSVQQQAEAIRLQTEVAEKIKQDVAEQVAKLQAELKPDQTVQSELTQETEVPQTDQMNALDLYDAARSAEQQLAAKYRHGRAMRLAILQDVPFSAALEAIDLVTPVRPQLSKAISTDARNESQLEEKKQVIREALAETGSMVSLGNTLVSQAIAARNQAGIGNGPGRISLSAIQARSAQMQQLETLANQEASGKAVDLAGAMQAGGEKRIKMESDESPPVIDQSIRPVAGRKVSDEGDAAKWMAVTQWQTLGPYSNAGRANIDRVFPPESLVDLSAVYLGKDDRTIRWTFTQSDHELGRVSPANEEPYGIWYAYTELSFDRPRDLWISMGSDDKGQVWINDIPVWMSASFHKNWSPGEALRRVHFNKGRNRILYRIENGQHGMGFSFWVQLSQK